MESSVTSMRSLACVMFAIALTAHAVRADITVRYRSDSKLVPPAMADRTIRIRENRARFSMNSLAALADFDKQELTVFDPARKAYATILLSQYGARIKAAMPEMEAAMAQMADLEKVKAALPRPGEPRPSRGSLPENAYSP